MADRKSRNGGGGSGGGRKLRRLLLLPFRALGYAVLGAVIWVAAYAVIPPPGGLYMAREWIRLGHLEHSWRSIDDISPEMALAVVAAEDADFCGHWGFDIEAIQKALKHNERGKRVRGASTISQQVAKNLFLWQGRSWLRKGLEAGFTLVIEAIWTKRRILEVYLNSVEFGEGVFGAEAAAQRYFDRPAAKLTLSQASRLAAVLPDPKRRDPRRGSSYMAGRSADIAEGARTLEVDGRGDCFR